MKKITRLLSLAAMIFSSTQAIAQQVGTIGVGDITFSADKRGESQFTEHVHSALNLGINSALAKTRKFTVLDYSQLKARLNEQGRNLNDYYAKKYSGNAVAQAGLDYILKADVTKFRVSKETLGSSGNETGLLGINFELIGVADATEDFRSSVETKFSARLEVGDQGMTKKALDNAVQQAVDQMVSQLVSRLFPVRVMSVAEDGTVTLNYGEGFLETGDTVVLYSTEADNIIDELGQVLGDVVMTLKITSAKRKFATAQVLGDQQLLKIGQKGQRLVTGS